MSRLDDRVVILTGGGGEIGRAVARGLATRGAHIAVVDIDALRGEDVAAGVREQGGDALFVAADVSQGEDVERMVGRVLAHFGAVHVLINNAALLPSVPDWTTLDESAWDRVLDVNLKSCFLCSKAVFPSMRQQGGGRIINVSSVTALVGHEGDLHYVASKAGMIGFTRALALQVGVYNITVNALAPGAVYTEREADLMQDPAWVAAIMRRQALQRRERPDDLIGAIALLASDDGSFITGQTIVVDGGWVLY